MFTILLSWQYWLRLFLAFLIPYLVFSAVMEQAAIRIDSTIDSIGDDPQLAIVGFANLPPSLTKELKRIVDIRTVESSNHAQQLLKQDSVASVIEVETPTQIKVTYNSSKDEATAYQFLELIEAYKKEQLQIQLDSAGLVLDESQQIEVREIDLFNPMLAINTIINQIKNSLANVLNLLFVLLVFWMVRNAILLSRHKQKEKILVLAFTVLLVGISGMLAVGLGFYKGISIEQEGMIQSVIFSIKELLKWDNTGSFLLLWIPCWLFLIGILGSIIFSTKNLLKSHVRSFWVVIVFSVVALLGLMPVSEPNLAQLLIPVYNVMNIGQLSMQGTLSTTDWWVAMGGTSVLALIALGIWWKLAKPMGEE